jgi:hypothetical protein
LRTDHFLEFDRRVNDWLVSKGVECWERLESDDGGENG